VSTLALLWLSGVGLAAVVLLLGVASMLAAQRDRLDELRGVVQALEERMRSRDRRRAARRGVPPDDLP
jgi:hypothetical protein